MFCEKIEPIVHELAKTYRDRVDCVVKSHNEGDSPDRIRRYALDRHGMVIVDGSDRVLWSESSHNQTKERVIAAIEKVLAGK